MALTRKMLKAMSIEDEKIDQIIEAHTETVESLKEARDTFKADAEKLGKVQKELDDLKATLPEDGKDPWKVKYDAIKEEYSNYKADVTAKETKQKKENAFRDLLKEIGVSEKRINTVLKVSDIEKLEFEEDGKVKEADTLKASLKEEWSDFIPTDGTKGAETSTPPASTGNKNTMTKEEIRAIKDPIARHKAMAENPEVVGLK